MPPVSNPQHPGAVHANANAKSKPVAALDVLLAYTCTLQAVCNPDDAERVASRAVDHIVDVLRRSLALIRGRRSRCPSIDDVDRGGARRAGDDDVMEEAISDASLRAMASCTDDAGCLSRSSIASRRVLRSVHSALDGRLVDILQGLGRDDVVLPVLNLTRYIDGHLLPGCPQRSTRTTLRLALHWHRRQQIDRCRALLNDVPRAADDDAEAARLMARLGRFPVGVVARDAPSPMSALRARLATCARLDDDDDDDAIRMLEALEDDLRPMVRQAATPTARLLGRVFLELADRKRRRAHRPVDPPLASSFVAVPGPGGSSPSSAAADAGRV